MVTELECLELQRFLIVKNAFLYFGKPSPNETLCSLEDKGKRCDLLLHLEESTA